MNLIDKGEQGYKTAHGRFTQHLADLLPLNTDSTLEDPGAF
jgi:hypothetical protein